MRVRRPFAAYSFGALGFGVALAAGCAGHPENGSSAFGGGTDNGVATEPSASSSSAAAPSTLVSQPDATLNPGPMIDAGAVSSATSGDGSSRPERCGEAGCTCFNIASIGHLGIYGDNTTELINWLNTESSAAVDLYQTKPTLTAAFLSRYDVIILQWLSDGNGGPYWQFSQSEVAALSDWVNAGGGLITLSGFEPNSGEVTPINNLLSFTDLSYNTDNVLTMCPATLPCNCWGNTVPVGPWAAGPIGSNITQIGGFHGRSINPGTATVDASGQDNAGNTIVYGAHESVGKGYVFAWCDEWVTYTSQWLGIPANTGAGPNPYTTPGNACYNMSAAQVFQVPQFWYNAITYAAQATSCPFTINNSTVIPR